MQRLFSSFPNGRPGLGLLFLRIAASLAMTMQAVKWLALTTGVADPTGGAASGFGSGTAMVLGALAIASAALLLAGFMTPIAATAATAIALIAADPAVIYIVAITLATILLGPGALSIDAHLYGRREIRIEM